MTLTTEDGTGIVGAESYSSVAAIDAYWAARTQLAPSALWAAATTALKEGAAREATAYIDGRWGASYRGVRAGYLQGLLWPRTGAKDDQGYELPGLPPELIAATSALAGRAVTAALSTDAAYGGAIKRTRVKAGPVESETEYTDGASPETKYGVILGILAPILDGTQGGVAQWNWA